MTPGELITPSVRLVKPIGRGGMGTVWLAEHLVLDTRVVVKLMSEGLENRADVLARFAREAMIAAQVKSPHVVQVFDSGTTTSGTPFIVMELLEGKDLGKWLLEHGPMPAHELVPIMIQIAKALSKAHRVGVVHRDIKPENIFLMETEGGEPFVKLLDFGTAKVKKEGVSSTDTGQVLGTPLYMSPEQILGEKEVDHRTDVWSLGVVAFEALTGRVPFEAATMAGLALAIHSEPPTLTSLRPELPRALDEWFARVCARDVAARFQSVRDAADAFVRATTGAPMAEPFESIAIRPITPRPQRVAAPALRSTLPKPGEESKRVNMAFGIVVAAAVAVGGIIVATSSSRSSSAAQDAPAATTTTAAATTPVPAPEPPKAPEPVQTVTEKAPPKPNPPMTKGPRAQAVKLAKPARPSLPAPSSPPAKPAAADDDLEKLSNIPQPGPPPKEEKKEEKAPPPEIPAE